MKIKVIMNSGKEYYSEKDDSIEMLIKRTIGESGTLSINYISLDEARKLYINTSHISSIELIEEKELEYDESDPIVY